MTKLHSIASTWSNPQAGSSEARCNPTRAASSYVASRARTLSSHLASTGVYWQPAVLLQVSVVQSICKHMRQVKKVIFDLCKSGNSCPVMVKRHCKQKKQTTSRITRSKLQLSLVSDSQIIIHEVVHVTHLVVTVGVNRSEKASSIYLCAVARLACVLDNDKDELPPQYCSGSRIPTV